ncbi:hypothetical protein JTE90_007644 [Oedothorax gibbosus]|uniref:LisH domain-containing protein n=1 Tax=Oedothorax gibbosus TaxID=931172 RepID=A0AAV6UJA4_9ARAC|nr:hypothetical protein JTE90_007644 [Oedothorax gibbosus]
MLEMDNFGQFYPSEVARLVLGYLEDKKCQYAWEIFLLECHDLQEHYLHFNQGKKHTTTVEGKSLQDILAEYCHIKYTSERHGENEAGPTVSNNEGMENCTTEREFSETAFTAPFNAGLCALEEKRRSTEDEAVLPNTALASTDNVGSSEATTTLSTEDNVELLHELNSLLQAQNVEPCPQIHSSISTSKRPSLPQCSRRRISLKKKNRVHKMTQTEVLLSQTACAQTELNPVYASLNQHTISLFADRIREEKGVQSDSYSEFTKPDSEGQISFISSGANEDSFVVPIRKRKGFIPKRLLTPSVACDKVSENIILYKRQILEDLVVLEEILSHQPVIKSICDNINIAIFEESESSSLSSCLPLQEVMYDRIIKSALEKTETDQLLLSYLSFCCSSEDFIIGKLKQLPPTIDTGDQMDISVESDTTEIYSQTQSSTAVVPRTNISETHTEKEANKESDSMTKSILQNLERICTSDLNLEDQNNSVEGFSKGICSVERQNFDGNRICLSGANSKETSTSSVINQNLGLPLQNTTNFANPIEDDLPLATLVENTSVTAQVISPENIPPNGSTMPTSSPVTCNGSNFVNPIEDGLPLATLVENTSVVAPIISPENITPNRSTMPMSSPVTCNEMSKFMKVSIGTPYISEVILQSEPPMPVSWVKKKTKTMHKLASEVILPPNQMSQVLDLTTYRQIQSNNPNSFISSNNTGLSAFADSRNFPMFNPSFPILPPKPVSQVLNVTTCQQIQPNNHIGFPTNFVSNNNVGFPAFTNSRNFLTSNTSPTFPYSGFSTLFVPNDSPSAFPAQNGIQYNLIINPNINWNPSSNIQAQAVMGNNMLQNQLVNSNSRELDAVVKSPMQNQLKGNKTVYVQTKKVVQKIFKRKKSPKILIKMKPTATKKTHHLYRYRLIAPKKSATDQESSIQNRNTLNIPPTESDISATSTVSKQSSSAKESIKVVCGTSKISPEIEGIEPRIVSPLKSLPSSAADDKTGSVVSKKLDFFGDEVQSKTDETLSEKQDQNSDPLKSLISSACLLAGDDQTDSVVSKNFDFFGDEVQSKTDETLSEKQDQNSDPLKSLISSACLLAADDKTGSVVSKNLDFSGDEVQSKTDETLSEKQDQNSDPLKSLISSACLLAADDKTGSVVSKKLDFLGDEVQIKTDKTFSGDQGGNLEPLKSLLSSPLLLAGMNDEAGSVKKNLDLIDDEVQSKTDETLSEDQNHNSDPLKYLLSSARLLAGMNDEISVVRRALDFDTNKAQSKSDKACSEHSDRNSKVAKSDNKISSSDLVLAVNQFSETSSLVTKTVSESKRKNASKDKRNVRELHPEECGNESCFETSLVKKPSKIHLSELKKKEARKDLFSNHSLIPKSENIASERNMAVEILDLMQKAIDTKSSRALQCNQDKVSNTKSKVIDISNVEPKYMPLVKKEVPNSNIIQEPKLQINKHQLLNKEQSKFQNVTQEPVSDEEILSNICAFLRNKRFITKTEDSNNSQIISSSNSGLGTSQFLEKIESSTQISTGCMNLNGTQMCLTILKDAKEPNSLNLTESLSVDKCKASDNKAMNKNASRKRKAEKYAEDSESKIVKCPETLNKKLIVSEPIANAIKPKGYLKKKFILYNSDSKGSPQSQTSKNPLSKYSRSKNNQRVCQLVSKFNKIRKSFELKDSKVVEIYQLEEESDMQIQTEKQNKSNFIDQNSENPSDNSTKSLSVDTHETVEQCNSSGMSGEQNESDCTQFFNCPIRTYSKQKNNLTNCTNAYKFKGKPFELKDSEAVEALGFFNEEYVKELQTKEKIVNDLAKQSSENFLVVSEDSTKPLNVESGLSSQELFPDEIEPCQETNGNDVLETETSDLVKSVTSTLDCVSSSHCPLRLKELRVTIERMTPEMIATAMYPNACNLKLNSISNSDEKKTSSRKNFDSSTKLTPSPKYRVLRSKTKRIPSILSQNNTLGEDFNSDRIKDRFMGSSNENTNKKDIQTEGTITSSSNEIVENMATNQEKKSLETTFEIPETPTDLSSVTQGLNREDIERLVAENNTQTTSLNNFSCKVTSEAITGTEDLSPTSLNTQKTETEMDLDVIHTSQEPIKENLHVAQQIYKTSTGKWTHVIYSDIVSHDVNKKENVSLPTVNNTLNSSLLLCKNPKLQDSSSDSKNDSAVQLPMNNVQKLSSYASPDKSSKTLPKSILKKTPGKHSNIPFSVKSYKEWKLENSALAQAKPIKKLVGFLTPQKETTKLQTSRVKVPNPKLSELCHSMSTFQDSPQVIPSTLDSKLQNFQENNSKVEGADDSKIANLSNHQGKFKTIVHVVPAKSGYETEIGLKEIVLSTENECSPKKATNNIKSSSVKNKNKGSNKLSRSGNKVNPNPKPLHGNNKKKDCRNLTKSEPTKKRNTSKIDCNKNSLFVKLSPTKKYPNTLNETAKPLQENKNCSVASETNQSLELKSTLENVSVLSKGAKSLNLKKSLPKGKSPSENILENDAVSSNDLQMYSANKKLCIRNSSNASCDKDNIFISLIDYPDSSVISSSGVLRVDESIDVNMDSSYRKLLIENNNRNSTDMSTEENIPVVVLDDSENSSHDSLNLSGDIEGDVKPAPVADSVNSGTTGDNEAKSSNVPKRKKMCFNSSKCNSEELLLALSEEMVKSN